MNKIRKPAHRRPKNITLPSFAPAKHLLSSEKRHILPLPSFYPELAPRFFQRECVSRVSYNSGNSSAIERSTRSAIDYLLKNEDVPLLASKQELTDLKTAQDFFKGKRILRICISPEDKGAPLEEVVRKTINTIEEKVGHKLVYLAATHTDTDHLHAHVVISREDGGNLSSTNLLIVPKRVLIKDCRETMKTVISDKLGYLNEKEYLDRFKKNIDEPTSAKIDFKIKQALAPYIQNDKKPVSATKNNIIRNIPNMFKGIAEERLDYLSTFGKEVGVSKTLSEDKKTETYTFKNPQWQDYLRNKDKSRIFEEFTKDEKVEIDNYKIVKNKYFEEYKGIIGDKKVIDYEKERVAFLLKDLKTNTYHYAEQNITYDHFNFYAVGDMVSVKSDSPLKQTAYGAKKNNRVKITKIDPYTLKPIKMPKLTPTPSIKLRDDVLLLPDHSNINLENLKTEGGLITQ